MTTRIEEFVAYLGWEVDAGDLEEFNDQVEGVVDNFKAVVTAVSAATAALSAAVVITNKQTAETRNLAKAVGVTTEFLLGMGGVVGEIGLKTENVVDLVEEMNNKFGEKAGLGKFSAVEDSVKILGLNFAEIKKLEPEKQFIRVLDAAKKLKDQQKAVSAVDMLLGGEGNKVLGFLRDIDGSVDDIIGSRLELNMLSHQGVEQAMEFNAVWGRIVQVVSSAWAQFSGIFGGAFSLLLSRLIAWTRQNNKLIKQKIAQWAETLAKAFMFLFKGAKEVLLILKRVTDSVGGLRSALRLLALIVTSIGIFKIAQAFQILVPLLISGVRAVGLFSAAMKLMGVPVAVIAILILLVALQDLKTWFEGGNTLFGAWGESLAEEADKLTDKLNDFLGLSDRQLQIWLVKLVDAHKEAFAELWRLLQKYVFSFEAVDRVFNAIKSHLRDIKKLASGVLERLLGAPSNEAFIAQKKAAQDRADALKLLDEAARRAGPASLGAINAAGLNQAASAAVLSDPLGTVSRGLQSTINRNRGGDTRVDVRNNFRVSQQPGESGEDFARRVAQIMEEEMAGAVRNNDTGITR
jgi:hypothetical protein